MCKREDVIIILKYTLLGLILYILIIPSLESLSALICQWLEVIKGKLIYQQALIQKQVDEVSKSENTSSTRAIGFSISTEEEADEYYEEENE